LFGRLVSQRGGAHAGTIDLKHNGIVPLVDLARVYALAGGITAANTADRLAQASDAGEVSAQGAHDLRDAFEFLAKLRITHQALQISRGEAPDNFLVLKALSNFERSHLKDAFSVVKTMQDVLGQRYQSGVFEGSILEPGVVGFLRCLARLFQGGDAHLLQQRNQPQPDFSGCHGVAQRGVPAVQVDIQSFGNGLQPV
jgi:hypothetical protein